MGEAHELRNCNARGEWVAITDGSNHYNSRRLSFRFVPYQPDHKPLIIRDPRRPASWGTHARSFAALQDLYRTVAVLAGLPPPARA